MLNWTILSERANTLTKIKESTGIEYITQFTSKKSLKKGIVGLIVGLGLLGTTQLAQADTVKVKPGDTLSEIAQVHHDTVAHLEKVNHLKNVAVIFPGDTLVTGKTNPKKAKVTDPLEPVTTHPESFNKPQAQSHYEAPKQAQVSSQSVTQVPQQSAPAKQATPAPQPQNTQAQSNSAKEQVAQIESRGDYNARNGQFVGRYQLTDSYLNGDYSEANQERVADKYVADRYGNWNNALSHERNFGWY